MQVYDYDFDGGHDLIGEFYTTTRQLIFSSQSQVSGWYSLAWRSSPHWPSLLTFPSSATQIPPQSQCTKHVAWHVLAWKSKILEEQSTRVVLLLLLWSFPEKKGNDFCSLPFPCLFCTLQHKWSLFTHNALVDFPLQWIHEHDVFDTNTTHLPLLAWRLSL